MVIYGALALLAVTPGTTCVLLNGLGIGHTHLGEEVKDEVVKVSHSHGHHHHHHGHRHSHKPVKVAEKSPEKEPLPCPEAVGISLETEYTVAKHVEAETPVWTLAAETEWTEEVVISTGVVDAVGRRDIQLGHETGSPGGSRVLFCSFLI